VSTNGFPPEAALRMHRSIEDSLERGGQGSRTSFYFDARGRTIVAGGRNFAKFDRSTQNGMVDLNRSMKATFVIEHPYRPSLASLADMVTEHRDSGERVIYNTERWEADPRVDEQISVYGPDVLDDWKLEALLDKLQDRDEEKIAA
jgi:hypothetical protein